MVKDIITLLDFANGETEAIRIAQGKYKLPETFKQAREQIKRNKQWRFKK